MAAKKNSQSSTNIFSSMSFLTRNANNVESLMLLMFIVGMAAVIVEAVALTPLHHQLVEAMNPAETIIVDGIEQQHHMTEAEIAESDRAFFWQAISVGLLVLVLAKMFVCSYMVRKQRQQVTPSEPVAKPKGLGDRELVFDKRQKIFHSFSRHLEYLFEDALTVRTVMTKEVVTIKPETSRSKLESQMKEQSFHHLIVVDDSQRLLGIIAKGDLDCKTGCTASELMTTSCVSIPKDMRLVPAITMMLERRIDCLPVLDGEKLCGIVTKTDMLLMLQSIVRTCSLPDIETRVHEVFRKRRACTTISQPSPLEAPCQQVTEEVAAV